MSGKLITFEGIEGVGKTTNVSFFSEFLTEQNISHITTREPGGTVIGEDIRNIFLLRQDDTTMNSLTELLLLSAARAQHIAEVIAPALAKNQVVLCDRFIDATHAYQGGGRGIAEHDILAIEKLVVGDLRPDFTVLFDLPVKISVERTESRGDIDRLEKETIGFFERVRQCYLDRAKAEPSRFAVIDAAQPLESVQQDLKDALWNVCYN